MRRKVSDSVPSLKSRGAKLATSKPVPGVPVDAPLGAGDVSDCSKGHDKGPGEAKPAVNHKGPLDK